MRLNRYLAAAGVASRRKADELIANGQVQVNGEVVNTLGWQVDETDLVTVMGHAVEPAEEQVVYLLHKPAGVISSASDPRGRTTVVALIRDRRRLFPIGRLDRDTTGALLLTNDGELANRLTHPRYGVEKRYLAEVKGRLPARAIKRLAGGMVLHDGFRVSARLRLVAQKGQRSVYALELKEGKNREVKRIFRHFGLFLVRLHRTEFAGLSADHLPVGNYRPLRREELLNLYQSVGLTKPVQSA
jgi:23S rRNA pseudouridine2605 synthase